MSSPLISPADLAARLDNEHLAIVDCRFSLADPDAGRAEYHAAHIPGAVYAHLDHDLSGPVTPGHTGRHPLPDPQSLAQTFGQLGIGAETSVVAYDTAGGAIAGRLWWLLRWLGHDRAQVLDGGWTAWKSEDRPVATGDERNEPQVFTPRPDPALLATADDLVDLRERPQRIAIDARAADRYRGEVEPIDPVAGHIPGARNAPFQENLTTAGRFLPPTALRERFTALIGDREPSDVICYCGSGVTACHNLLALEHAGLSGARLYVGSWSEWIVDRDRPVATGPTA